MKYALTLLMIASGLYALEANMFQQQKWNVEQMKEARQRRFTPTRTATRGRSPTRTPFISPTPTATRTPNR